MTVPAMLQPVLWNARVEVLEVERDASTIIPAVLRYGWADHVGWLFSAYGRERVRDWIVADNGGLRTLPMAVRRFWILVLAPEEWSGEEERMDIVERWRPRRTIPM